MPLRNITNLNISTWYIFMNSSSGVLRLKGLKPLTPSGPRPPGKVLGLFLDYLLSSNETSLCALLLCRPRLFTVQNRTTVSSSIPDLQDRTVWYVVWRGAVRRGVVWS